MGLLRLFKGGEAEPKGSAAGAAIVAMEHDQFIARGYGRIVNVGAMSAPITGGGAGTTVDLSQPELVIAVPPKYVLLPISIYVQCQAPVISADSDEMEIIARVQREVSWQGDGTFTVQIPHNMRTDIYPGSACRVASAFTANMTTDGSATPPSASTTSRTGAMELDHAVKVADFQTGVGVLWNKLEMRYQPKVSPQLVGPCIVYLYWGGTAAVSGFAQVAWIEGPDSEIFI